MTAKTTEAVTITPGAMTLADWRAIYEGASAALDAGAWDAIDASAAAVARIVAKGDPVYGINTGFGKLASVRIASDDLATLQRNIVLSHAAGTGAPSPVPVVRLMMALKLASFGVGASGVRRETVAMLEAMLATRPDPRRPVAGLGRRERRPRAAVAHGRGDDRGRRDRGWRRDPARRRRARAGGPRRRSNSARRKASRCSTARNFRPPMRSRACSAPKPCSSRR